jgi:hypothetical protein
MKIDHIEEIEALSRQALDDEHKARSLTKAIVKATEHWHEEAKDQLATKEDLHTLTWRFIGLMGLMTAVLLGAMYFMHSDEIAYINNALAHLKP